MINLSTTTTTTCPLRPTTGARHLLTGLRSDFSRLRNGRKRSHPRCASPPIRGSGQSPPKGRPHLGGNARATVDAHLLRRQFSKPPQPMVVPAERSGFIRAYRPVG